MWSQLSVWVNARFPLKSVWNKSAADYYAPKNLNFWYYFGVFSVIVFVIQIATGIFLAMYYTPTEAQAFNSIEHIMRDVRFGWLIRYMHTTGASAFFIVVYLHIYRCIMYGSFKKPRELLWLFGMVVYVVLLAEAYTGYVLPWGQMSYWASQVITSLFESIPWIGHSLVIWLRGDYTVSGVLLHRFFAYHAVAMPLTLSLLVIGHLISLHTVGSNNPDGVEISDHLDQRGKPMDGIPFHPYYTVKDVWGLGIFLTIFALIMFYFPTLGGHFIEYDNYIPASKLITPAHIRPIWYMSPYYAILRAIPYKLPGVIAMAAAIAVLFVLPWLDRSRVRSIRYRGIYSKISLTVLVVSFVSLGYLGIAPATPLNTLAARLFTALYFSCFVLMPLYTAKEKTKQPPLRVTRQ